MVAKRRWPPPSHDAAAEVATGGWDDQFPVDVFQTGSGTSTNMNMNEVHRRPGRPSGSAGRSTPTTRSTPRSRPTTCSRRPSTSPRSREIGGRPAARARPPGGRRSAAKAERARRGGEGRAAPTSWTPRRSPSGQELGGYAAQVGRRPPSGCGPRCRGSASSRSAAPRSAPGSTHPPGFAAAVVAPARRATSACRSPRRPTTSPPRAPATSWSSLSGDLRALAVGARQDRQRPPLDGVGAPDRPGRDPPARPPARVSRSCRAR